MWFLFVLAYIAQSSQSPDRICVIFSCYCFLLSMSDKIDCIYQGCMRKNADGTNRIISPKERCLLPTARAFWKYIEDIPNTGVKTPTQYNKQPLVTNRAFETYFRNKNKEDIELWETAPDSEVYVLKPSDRFYII